MKKFTKFYKVDKRKHDEMMNKLFSRLIDSACTSGEWIATDHKAGKRYELIYREVDLNETEESD